MTDKNEKPRQLVYNSVTCTACMTTIVSYHRHDYKTCICENRAMVDGGISYLRYGAADMSKIKLFAVYADDDHELVRKYATRGSRGKNGDEPLKWVPICEMSDDYLAAVLDYGAPEWHLHIITNELQYRRKHGISIAENETPDGKDSTGNDRLSS